MNPFRIDPGVINQELCIHRAVRDNGLDEMPQNRAVVGAHRQAFEPVVSGGVHDHAVRVENNRSPEGSSRQQHRLEEEPRIVMVDYLRPTHLPNHGRRPFDQQLLPRPADGMNAPDFDAVDRLLGRQPTGGPSHHVVVNREHANSMPACNLRHGEIVDITLHSPTEGRVALRYMENP